MCEIMNNEVKIEINGFQIEVKVREYKGWRVVTLADIDRLHNRPAGTAKRNFNKNKKRFIEGEDFFKITPYEFRTALGEEMDSRQQNDIILLTESGYLMLVNGYFHSYQIQAQKQNKYSNFDIPMIVDKLKSLSEEFTMLK